MRPVAYTASGFRVCFLVPIALDLPAASFRPHLPMTVLAVQLTVPVIRVRRGLPPPSKCALPGPPEEGIPDSGIPRKVVDSSVSESGSPSI